jgi:FtsP/CotA-like multicopper oxidase with cupredoxin domain
MNKSKVLNIMFLLVLLTGLIFGSTIQAKPASAAPASPVDESKVPHYFGPYPNWANSPLTLPDAQVVITGDGSGATAVATVGANGSIVGITVTNPGSNYSNAKVDITGSGTGAQADATIVKKGAVVAVTVDLPGTGYTAPTVTFSGNGGAAGTVYGGVEAVSVIPGSGYTFPTVDFDLPDAPDGIQARGHAVCLETDCLPANPGDTLTVIGVVIDYPGSGYSTAPGLVIRDGTIFDPINPPAGFTEATATSTLFIQSINLDAFGGGYNTPPTVTINDPTGTGAAATAVLDNGIISAITIKKAGSGYLTPGGIRKFVDTLPGLGPGSANNLGQYLPIAQPDTTTFPGTDYYVIAVVQHREKLHSDLNPTLLREYVQLSTAVVPGSHVALQTDLKAGGTTPTLMPDGTQAYGVDNPHYLGPVIVAQKDRAVRIVFYNLLPTGSEGDLFLPTDSTIMGSGMGPMAMTPPVDLGTVTDEVRNPLCTEYPKDGMNCFTDNRATLHLHGGITPWISDGTPHQWITPANEMTDWPQGVSVQNVPDMIGASAPINVPDCSAPNDGCQTFYYTNQQSARLMFYHDHAWGITRLNVYAGEAAGYLITDPTEQALFGPTGTFASLGEGLPLIIQDRTFVPDAAQLAAQDPTWDAARWGGAGNFWYHHVYMPAQNPGDPSGMSAYGRWMYGPWFWPPATDTQHGPILNPYYNMDPATGFTTSLAVPCNLDDPATWQYQTDPFCEPQYIPGTPNISAGMEQFNDTPLVNGTAYPTVTLDPKSYRLRILNAANDRFWNLQWYVADSTGTEVALKAAEVAAAQTDPNIFPTPDTAISPAGPSWIQIATEGGFLPAPVVIPNQPITWITDPTRFDVGNVDKHSLLLAPAERADVIVDFSQFAGKTLILYNDAPAAFPARVASYDYYTGGPDLSPAGAPTTLPGYGPNTRTIMQVKIAANPPAAAFNLTTLTNAFKHKANGTGVFEASQHPIIVGQAAYNSAYGTSFAASGWCSSPTSTIKCDGLARISQQGGDPFTFDTLRMNANGTYPTGYAKISIPLQPKAIHDEMNSSSFDEFGRMTANLGVEAVPATPGLQNVVLIPYTGSPTEIIDASKLPTADVKVTPIAVNDDGTQIWKITHNGVDTHPIHFHLYDVQVLNRVTWDNIIIQPDANELGWKDTVRISPLEDTIVALRPIIPHLPFDLPNSVHELSPMMPDGEELYPGQMFDPQGNPIQVFNHLINYGWEYVYHCHILSHEEMDMMRPVLVAIPPVAPTGATNDGFGTISWIDSSLSETAFVVEKSADAGITWVFVNRIDRVLGAPNTTGEVLSVTDPAPPTGDQYRVYAENTVGDTATVALAAFPVVTVKSVYAYAAASTPAAPTSLSVTLVSGPEARLSFTDNASNEDSFIVERADNGGAFALLATLAAFPTTGTVSYADPTVVAGNSYTYQVAAVNTSGTSPFSNQASATVPTLPPLDPTGLTAVYAAGPSVDLAWTDNASDEDGYVVERSTDGISFGSVATLPANSQTYADTTVAFDQGYTYRVYAFNIAGNSGFAVSAAVSTPPVAPTGLTTTYQTGPQVLLTWVDQSSTETAYVIESSLNGGTFSTLVTLGAGVTSYTDASVVSDGVYTYRVSASNAAGASGFSNTASLTTPPTAPASFAGTASRQGNRARVALTWSDTSVTETGFVIQISTNGTTWNTVTTTAANVTTFTVTGLNRNTNYYFQIQSVNATGASAWVPLGPILTP